MNMDQKMERAWRAFDESETERKLSASSDVRSFPPFPSPEMVRDYKPAGSESPSMYKTIQRLLDGDPYAPQEERISEFRNYN